MSKYEHLTKFKTYGVRDLSRGKTTEAIKESLSQPVLIVKNNKPQCVMINYEEYLKLLKENKNGNK